MNDSVFTIGFKQGQEHGKQIMLEKIDDIKANIKTYINAPNLSNKNGVEDGLRLALKIIDKHIGE